jgi:hypothetical protein
MMMTERERERERERMKCEDLIKRSPLLFVVLVLFLDPSERGGERLDFA